MTDAPKRPNLVIVRTGKQSIHTEWVKNLGGTDRNWDLLLSHYGSTEATCPDAEIIVQQAGFKYSAVGRLFADIKWLKNYNAVWLCDDDIMTSWANINAMFDLFRHYELALAQPALTPDSYFSHDICVQQPGMFLHFTNFVEIMVPIFSMPALQACQKTFADAVTGWGLDWVWPHLLGNPRNKIAILDVTPVRHTRPVRRNSDVYLDAAQHQGGDPFTEHDENIKKYGVAIKPLIYGYITLQPQQFGGRSLETLSPALAAQQDKVAALLSPTSPARATLPDWQSPADSAAKPHTIPALSADNSIMSFGLHLNLQPPSGNAIEILQIGAARDQARVLVDAYPAGPHQYRLNLRLFSADNSNVDIPLPPLLSANRSVPLKIQLVPCTGYVKVWLKDLIVEQGLIIPWQWRTVDCLWLGSKRLKGSLHQCWISSDIAEKYP